MLAKRLVLPLEFLLGNLTVITRLQVVTAVSQETGILDECKSHNASFERLEQTRCNMLTGKFKRCWEADLFSLDRARIVVYPLFPVLMLH